jgi:hypothetical protein
MKTYSRCNTGKPDGEWIISVLQSFREYGYRGPFEEKYECLLGYLEVNKTLQQYTDFAKVMGYQTLKLFVQATWEVVDKELVEGMSGKHDPSRSEHGI